MGTTSFIRKHEEPHKHQGFQFDTSPARCVGSGRELFVDTNLYVTEFRSWEGITLYIVVTITRGDQGRGEVCLVTSGQNIALNDI